MEHSGYRVAPLFVAPIIGIGVMLSIAVLPAAGQAWAIVPESSVVYEQPVAYFATGELVCGDICCDDPCGDVGSCDAYCGECPSCDLGDCCCDCGPRWKVRAGAIFLHRSRPGDDVLIENTVSGNPIETFSDFSFDMEAGPDVYVLRRGQRFDMDFRFFMVDEWSSQLNTETSPIWNFPWDPPLFGLGVADVTSVYRSRLYSSEVNARRCISRSWDVLAGFRYVQLDERVDVNADFGGNDALIWTETTNDLYGFQLGGDGVLWNRGGRIRFENTVKGGIYFNDAGSASGVNQNVGPAFGTEGEGNNTAFLGEYDIQAVYQLTCRTAIRAGYQLMFLEGVAVVSDQYPLQDVLDERSQVDVHGGPFYHGATVSVETTW